MSFYTTGALAKIAGVSVRTVQYYDQKKLVSPIKLSEGNRRLYSDAELKRLNLILLLKSLGLSLTSIRDLLNSPHFDQVLSDLLEQQRQVTEQALEDYRKKLKSITQIQDSLNANIPITPNTIFDIETTMRNRKRLVVSFLIFGILVDIFEVWLLWIGFTTGHWLIPALGFIAVIGVMFIAVDVFRHHVIYICPACKTKFQPSFWAFSFAKHTPKTRKLTCPNCSYHGFCAEVMR